MTILFKSGYRITQHYKENPDVYKKFNLAGHEGLDCVPLDNDWSIYALDEGVVIRDFDDARKGGAYGNYITIWNAKERRAFYYCHNTENYVSMGDIVTKGQKISKMGNTGNSSGPHLHISMVKTDAQGNRVNTANGFQGFIDPEPFIKSLENDKGLIGYDGKSREAEWYLREWGEEKQLKEELEDKLEDATRLIGENASKLTQCEKEATEASKLLRQEISTLTEANKVLSEGARVLAEQLETLERELKERDTEGYGAKIVNLEKQVADQLKEITSLRSIRDKSIDVATRRELISELAKRFLRG